MQNELNKWLTNPKRDYASGLAFFNALARPEMKKNYGVFFNDVREEDKAPNSMKLNMLTNSLSKISHAIKVNPALFTEALATATPSTASLVHKIVDLSKKVEVLSSGLTKQTYGPGQITQFTQEIESKKTAIDTANQDKTKLETNISELQKADTPEESKIADLQKQLDEKTAEIQTLEEQKEDLEQKLQDLQDELDNAEFDKDELQSQYEASVTEIEDLKKELEEKGLKVLSDVDLPKNIKEKRERISQIVPLMAVIHAEMAVETLTDEERKAKAEELCKLDDERRTLWDDVDDFLEGKESVLISEKVVEYSEDPLVKGAQISKRIDRLKENIARGLETANNPKAKPNIATRAAKRAEAYQKELDELEALVKNDAQ